MLANTVRENRMRSALLVLPVAGGVILAGCSSDTGTSASAAAIAAGPDTYTMSERFAPVGVDAADAERDTLFKASHYCAQKGRQFVEVSKNLSGNMANPYGPTDFTVTFKCLSPSDPAAAPYPAPPPPSQPPGR
jgi:putative hemolysin